MNAAALFPPWLSHIPIDWIIIAIFALIVMFDALRSGSGRASVLALALPIAAFFSDLLPRTYLLGSAVAPLSTPTLQAGLFLVVFGIIYILTYRIVYTLGSGARGLLFAALSGISATIITIVMWLQVPALDGIWHFGTQVETIFGSTFAFIWLIGAYLVLAFIRS